MEDGDDNDKETSGDVGGVGEDGVEVAEEEGEGDESTDEGEDRAENGRRDEGEPLQGDEG